MHIRYIFFLLIGTAFLLNSCGDGSVTDHDNDNDPDFSFDHERDPGSSAVDFLTNDDFGNLVIEIQYMTGFRPEAGSLNNLKSFLEERLNKSSITILEPSEIPAAAQSSYTAGDVMDLEKEHRTTFSEENQLAAYFIILDSEYSQGNVLGIAYYNTSMALFGKTINSVSGGLGQPSKAVVETIVMKHEAGHLIGLVNNGVEMQEHHQDEANEKHCDVDSCLMYYAVNTTDFIANIFGGNIPELDELCIADLQAAGGR